jgi:uncharacterized protein (DUF433 family)
MAGFISSDKGVLLGKPIVKGSRISIELILELMSNGWTEKMILESYPTLTEDDIKAVFAFLRECMQNEKFFHLPKAG